MLSLWRDCPCCDSPYIVQFTHTYPGRWRSASSMREKVKIAKLCVKWWRLHDTKQTMQKPTHLCCIGCILLSFLKRSFCFSSRSAVKPLRGTRSNAKRNDTSYGRWGRTWEAFYQQSLKLREGSWQIAIYKLLILSKNTKCTYQSELSCKLHHWGLENYSTGDGGHMQKADSCQLSKATRVSSKNLTDLIFNIFKDVPPLKILQMIQISLSTCRFHLFSMCRFRRVSCCGILMASWSLSAIPDRFSSTVSEGVRGRGTCETNLSYFQIFQVLGGRLFYLVLKRFQSLFF